MEMCFFSFGGKGYPRPENSLECWCFWLSEAIR